MRPQWENRNRSLLSFNRLKSGKEKLAKPRDGEKGLKNSKIRLKILGPRPGKLPSFPMFRAKGRGRQMNDGQIGNRYQSKGEFAGEDRGNALSAAFKEMETTTRAELFWES